MGHRFWVPLHYYQSIQRDLPEDHATLQGWEQEKRNNNEWATEEHLLWEDCWKRTKDAFLESAAETYPARPGTLGTASTPS